MIGVGANGYSDESAGASAGLNWTGEDLSAMESAAESNVMTIDWTRLKAGVKRKLAEAIRDFLDAPTPASLTPEEASHARERACDVLDSFAGPPFTVQRLCELVLYPRRQYRSLAKYLRAVNRVLSVTSEQSAFSEDEAETAPLASTSATTLDTTLGLVGQGVIHPPIPSPSSSPIATRRPSASPSLTGSPRTSPQVVPLLSPIPWLKKSDSASENGDVESFHLSSPRSTASPSTASPSTASPSTATVRLPAPVSPASDLHSTASTLADILPHPETATPTGGLVDEVDPGSGGAETAEPVALSGAMSLSSEEERHASSSEDSRNGNEPSERSASLAERFTRASSPKVEMPLDPEEGVAADEVRMAE